MADPVSLPVPTAVATALADAWQEHWGRLVAALTARYRRVDLVEDVAAEAYARAAERWPIDGLPDNPAGWLVTTARRRMIDVLRAEAVAARRHPLLLVEAAAEEPADGIGDDRLRLILLCCHPALAPPAQIALALRFVLGVPTEDLARLFLIPHPTMSARLTRAKRKLATAGIPLRLPGPTELEPRLEMAVRAVYLGFTAGYVAGSGPDLLRVDLAGEAIRLGRALDQVATRPVVTALLALLLLQHSRRDARVRDGRLVVLAEQDRRRWHRAEIEEGLSRFATLAPTDGLTEELRLQAMIAAEHVTASTAAQTDWRSIAAAYARLEQLTGSPVVRLNRAVAVAQADGPRAGLALLDGLAERLGHHHRLPAVQADLLARAGDLTGAREAYATAMARAANEVELRHLAERLAGLPELW